ncbi:MAG: carboxylesterase family protein [Actinomycetota bacterium]|nr:carboxylesterase family protein [Actinomycetota bacterium]
MTEVRISTGVIRGKEEDGVLSFLGVPYAQAPLGPLRFRAPQPRSPWEGVLDATSFASAAVQTPMNPDAPSQVMGSEDCLHLNVWTPSLDGKRPIVFWVHGGAFVMGDGNTDGASLAAQGAVVVAVNYRIGPFGYLYLDDIAPGIVDTNLALRDLSLALDWVRENAAIFGGDPDSIGLLGRSSGAMTVGAMLAMPACAGKFAGAWLMSGAARQVRDRETATRSARVFLRAAGLASEDAAQIVNLSTEEIVNAARVLANNAQLDTEFDAEVVLPVFGDDVLPLHPMAAIRAGAVRDVALCVSWTLKDMGLWRKFDPVNGGKNKELFARRLIGNVRWKELEVLYEKGGDDWYVDLLTDFHFAMPAIRLAEAQIEAGGRSYVGRFDRTPVTPPWPDFGPVHTVDMFYLFTPLATPSGTAGVPVGDGMLDEDVPTTLKVRDLLLGVAQGEPSTTDVKWPHYQLSDRSTLLFGEAIEVVHDPAGERRASWAGLLERP